MNNVKNKWCVYVHITPSNKFYVGITSNKPEIRWKNGAGYKRCPYFYKAIEKYGWENIYHEIVASNLTEDEAKNFEKLLISKLKTNDPTYGYNLTLGGDGTSGIHKYGENASHYGKRHSEETKELIRSIKLNNPYKNNREKVVLQFDSKGNLVARHDSVNAAGKSIGKSHCVIAKVCRGIGNSAYGYKWIYESDYLKSDNIHTGSVRKHNREVLQFDINWKYIKSFSSIKDAATNVNRYSQSIIYACKTGGLSGGYHWKYNEVGAK